MNRLLALILALLITLSTVGQNSQSNGDLEKFVSAASKSPRTKPFCAVLSAQFWRVRRGEHPGGMHSVRVRVREQLVHTAGAC
jgi:hypothetical protein